MQLTVQSKYAIGCIVLKTQNSLETVKVTDKLTQKQCGAPCSAKMPSQSYRDGKCSTWVSERDKSVQDTGGHVQRTHLCLGLVNYYVGIICAETTLQGKKS